VAVTAGLLGAVVNVMLGFKTTVLVLSTFLFLRSAMRYVMQPAFRSLQADLVPQQYRGKEFGVVQASQNLGSVLGPIIGGEIYDLFRVLPEVPLAIGFSFVGDGLPFFASALFTLVAFVALLLLVKSPGPAIGRIPPDGGIAPDEPVRA
jgi:sugar phosphate permease